MKNENQKTKIFACIGLMLLLAACEQSTDSGPDIQFHNGFPKLSDKVATLRLSYKVNEVYSADFGESHFESHGYTGREKVTENHHKYYMEIYEDNSMAYAIERYSGKWKTSEGLVRFIDDRVEHYDAQRMLLRSAPYALADETAQMSELLDLKESVLLQNTKPSALYALIKPSLMGEASNVWQDGQATYFKIPSKTQVSENHLRTEGQSRGLDVAYNELIYSEEHGVPIEENGYNAAGELVDKLTYFYKINQQGEYIMSAEQYSCKKWSYQDSSFYVTHTDTFYSDQEITNL